MRESRCAWLYCSCYYQQNPSTRVTARSDPTIRSNKNSTNITIITQYLTQSSATPTESSHQSLGPSSTHLQDHPQPISKHTAQSPLKDLSPNARSASILFQAAYIIISQMLAPCKILPIHSTYRSNGKLLTLTEKFKRTHSALSKTHSIPTPSIDQQPRLYRPRGTSQVIDRPHRMLVHSPAKQLIEFPAFLTDGASDGILLSNKSVKSSNKKRNYLSRKVLQKQLLQSYLDNIFQRVSMIRANQTHRLSETRRARTRSTLTSR